MPDVSSPSQAPINAKRLQTMMEDVSKFGGGPDGAMTRLTLSKEDGQARDWLGQWFSQNGFELAVDAIGNQFGKVTLAGSNAPVVMVGSHIDSQPNGGRFDGAFGVIAACEAILSVSERLKAENKLSACNFQVVNWTNEEGARFQPSLLGSSVFTGAAELDWALDRADGDGVTVRQSLEAIGYAGKDKVEIPDLLVELHIEGDSHLFNAGERFGIFTRYWGATKYRLAFLGRQAHTGATPMAQRKDAVLAAAYLIADLKNIANEHGLDLHTSVGRLEIFPNSPNVVPAEAVLFIELRSGSPEVLAEAEHKMKMKIDEASLKAGVTHEVRSIDRRKAGSFAPGLIRLAEDAAANRGQTSRHLDTIGGHDAVALSNACPSIVLAVQSRDGVIHHPTEYTSPEDQALGTQILADMLYRLASEGVQAAQFSEAAE
ncbi:Zn-dependent hydrolase [Rhizobium rhizogenes]|uniref:Zn-dependent hydrolase n=1 Tax=Rhizobium rhizogenes TaxID=359 RepID=UPI00055FCD93|nr:Zn-dependent hydrolase [Rhizobium rhizogenes]NTH16336.1 Zn-dependent hydrolase [Rhizobium rhizogenes]NTH81290.1 Zn-dependent hydrolase [Rhizobium rhizogenes]NTH87267.1 Zn-dependent hydrolase [Rhizobium rhizogenes]NTI26479.1 Zn-dependent hydrolase [Rhizobium rhizogenes]NTI65861.1 Zn-dependent hydrolase [Rhizobium rhizogenes]